MVKVLFKCRGKRQSAVGGKVFIFLLSVLLCFALLTGCKGGQDNGNDTPTGGIVAATSTPTATPAVTGGPTPTPTATPFPTLPIEFARKTYETYECENLYRIPIEGLEDQKTLKDVKYFLFTDELRESRDGYPKKLAQVAEAGAGVSRTKYSFDADDSSYSEIWDGWFIGFDHDTKSIYYEDSYGILHRFDYGQ